AQIDCSLEVAVEFTIIGSLLQITVKREKEHEAASFGLIASFSQEETLALRKPSLAQALYYYFVIGRISDHRRQEIGDRGCFRAPFLNNLDLIFHFLCHIKMATGREENSISQGSRCGFAESHLYR
ncbi:MAG: hypothetical protein VCF07_13545, partial [Nitrospinota bacterium]